MSRLLILGTSGRTGACAADAARALGHDVRAGNRSPASDAEFKVDLLSGNGLYAALDGVDAVISCVGVANDLRTLLDPPPLYSTGAEMLAAAMRRTGVSRCVVISALWSRSNTAGPLKFRMSAVMALTRVYADMRRMEDRLSAEHLDTVAVRAGYLHESAAEHHAFPGAPPAGWWRTDRRALGGFLVQCAVSETLESGARPAFVHA